MNSLVIPTAYSENIMFNNRVKYTIGIHGNIGAGKSTLINILKKNKDSLDSLFNNPCIFVDEPTKDWSKPILENNSISPLQYFYNNIDKENGISFVFQIYAFTTRLEYLIKSINNECNKDELSIVFSDRTMRSDYLFFKNLYKNEFEWTTYQRFYNMICTNVNELEKLIIYVESSPEDCYKKCKLRNNQGDKNITLEYLISLNEKHEEMIKEFELNGGHVLRFKWNFEPDENKRNEYVNKFIKDELTNYVNNNNK